MGCAVYDPVLLRTFLAVAQTLSFTQASASLGIRQPTVSQHVRRLEETVGRRLFVRDTRTVALTADGEVMAGFARTILAAQEHAVDYFTGSGLSGRLRVGVTDDLALTPLPRILREFREQYSRVVLELTVAQSANLHRRVETGHLDIALVKQAPGQGGGRLVRRDHLVWAAVDGVRVDPDRPVPLVVYRAPSISRSLGVEALERARVPYRVTCAVHGVNGVIAGVRAGLGVAIFARSLIPEDLTEVPANANLPKLGNIDLVLLTSSRAPTEAAEALAATILATGHAARVR